MPKLGPVTRRELIRKLREAGFDGPYSGGKHQFVYEVLPDDRAAKSNYIRVIDNEGEDYLYPADYFIFVAFPQAVEECKRR